MGRDVSVVVAEIGSIKVPAVLVRGEPLTSKYIIKIHDTENYGNGNT